MPPTVDIFAVDLCVLQDDLASAGGAPRQIIARNFYGKQHQPAFIVGPSVQGSGLQARLNPGFNPVATQPLVRAPHPFPRMQKALQHAENAFARGAEQPSSSMQTPKPLALAAFSPDCYNAPGIAKQDGASRAAEQQAWQKV